MVRFRKRNKHLTFLFLLLFLLQDGEAAPALRIAGSSAVFPFAATVAEYFGHKTHEPIPLVEAIGTGAGIKLFCGSRKGPDGVMTSRPLTEGEKEKCRENAITFEEFKIGQDGLVLIQNKKEIPFSLTLHSLRDALAQEVSQEERCVENPYQKWSDIHKEYPSSLIQVLGPAPTSGTYDVLAEKIRGPCGSSLRHDGAYIEAPANENLIVQKIRSSPHRIGIVTFSFYDQNSSHLNALPLEGVLPSFSSIQSGKYGLSRPLYLYIKTNHIKEFPARVAYVIEFTSQDAIGNKGYLNEKGLIPLSAKEQAVMHERALALQEKKTP